MRSRFRRCRAPYFSFGSTASCHGSNSESNRYPSNPSHFLLFFASFNKQASHHFSICNQQIRRFVPLHDHRIRRGCFGISGFAPTGSNDSTQLLHLFTPTLCQKMNTLPTVVKMRLPRPLNIRISKSQTTTMKSSRLRGR